MSENKPRAFIKKYGSRKEVFDGVAKMTRGGLESEDLFLDDQGVIRSVKQQESLKKSGENLVRKEKRVVPQVEPSSDSEYEDGGDAKAVPLKAMNINDLKDAVKNLLGTDKLPKGHSKWKKQQWIEKARELDLVC